MNGYGVTIIPRSWALGVWHKPHKTILAFGPLRFTKHWNVGTWKEAVSMTEAERVAWANDMRDGM